MWKSYLKLAGKVLLRRKFFTFISLFGISFTLLVLLVATAILDHLLAPAPPEPRADRTLYVTSLAMIGPESTMQSNAGYGFLDRWVRTLPGVERVALVSRPDRLPLYHRGEKVVAFARNADAAFWEITDFDFLEGGPFSDEDDREGRRLAVINRSMRERLFDGEPALGRTFELDGQTFRVAGVVADVPSTRFTSFSEIWLPIGTRKGEAYRREILGDFTGLILARDRADFPDIKAEFRARLERVDLPDPDRFETLQGGADTMFEAWSRDLFGSSNDESHPQALRAAMLGAMLLFLLLPTVNLVNINLSRILERASEIGVRKAFGASSWTLVGQFVVENVVLTLAGGMVGLGLAWIVLHALNASGSIPYSAFHLDLRIFGYAILLAAFFGVLSGVYPAWRMSRLHPAEALRGRTA
jgi:putative ABC transport system permease protein